MLELTPELELVEVILTRISESKSREDTESEYDGVDHGRLRRSKLNPPERTDAAANGFMNQDQS